MQVQGSVKLSAGLLTFPLQVCQELTQTNVRRDVQVPELGRNSTFMYFYYNKHSYLDSDIKHDETLCWFCQHFCKKVQLWTLLYWSSVFSSLFCCECICGSTHFGGLLVSEDLRVDSVQLQDDFVHQLRVQPPVSFQEAAVLHQLLRETVCKSDRTDHFWSLKDQSAGLSIFFIIVKVKKDGETTLRHHPHRRLWFIRLSNVLENFWKTLRLARFKCLCRSENSFLGHLYFIANRFLASKND